MRPGWVGQLRACGQISLICSGVNACELLMYNALLARADVLHLCPQVLELSLPLAGHWRDGGTIAHQSVTGMLHFMSCA